MDVTTGFFPSSRKAHMLESKGEGHEKELKGSLQGPRLEVQQWGREETHEVVGSEVATVRGGGSSEI